MKVLLFGLFLSVFASCTKDDVSPEGALKSFVNARSGNVVTREYIMGKVTGEMKANLENISDEEFAMFSDLRNIKNNSFKILSKSCQENKCFITYAISYITKDDKEVSAYSSEVKKIAEVVNENGKWLIATVSNIKTYHEALEPINP